jgi:hypothetical protein
MNTDQHVNIEGDLVLVHYRDKPAFYARIEAIDPDIRRDWYQVTLLILTVPSQTVTWILREEYINGGTFTMGGEPIRLEKVERMIREKAPPDSEAPSENKETRTGAKVITLKKKT